MKNVDATPCFVWNENFGRVTFMLEQILGLARHPKVSPMTDITIMNAQVLHAFFTEAWALGFTVAIDAVRMADETGVHVWDSQVLGNVASCALSMGGFATADDLLKSMESRLAWAKRIDIGYYHGLRGCQESHRNDFPAACRHLELTLESFMEQMRSRFLNLLEKAGGYCETFNQWEKAATWYKKGIEVDILSEEFHQRLMVCYGSRDRRRRR